MRLDAGDVCRMMKRMNAMATIEGSMIEADRTINLVHGIYSLGKSWEWIYRDRWGFSNPRAA